MTGSQRSPHTQAALERFADLVARFDAGEAVDFDAEFRSPPGLEQELLDLHRNWKRLRGLLESVRAGASELRTAESEAGGKALELDPRTQRLLELLTRFRGHESRYEVLGEIARGGMGMVLRVREKGVERELALKRMFSPEELTPEMLPLRAQLLRRLLDEAWTLSRLHHPSIVQLHELGVDEEGRVYFTMPLVRGRTLAEIFEFARAGLEGWTIPRALGLLVRVCDALSFAHSLGIVHRDLKPANVMVGRFGELQVMDWGLASSQRKARQSADPGASVRATDALEGDAGLTLGGDVLGTPAYMAPEQALGQSAEVTGLADVYALGAMLYELLAGVRPYHEHNSSRTAREMLAHVKAGPPTPVEELAPEQRPELLAICRKAMQREPGQRYASMEALAQDLGAFREGRVVRALESGAWAELRKWIGRNRLVAAGLCFGVVSLLGAAAIALWIDRRADERVRFEADRRGPAALLARAELLWPARPERIPELEAWLNEAHDLVEHAQAYRLELELLRREAETLSEDDPRLLAAEAGRTAEISKLELGLKGARDETSQLLKRGESQGAKESDELWKSYQASVQARISVLRRQRAADLVHVFAEPARQQRHDALSALLSDLEPLLEARPYGNSIADVAHRLESARSLRVRSLEVHAQEWAEACASIRNPAACPLYEGLVLEPQLGLVPLGRDPQSGLWEFAHIDSGEIPARRPDGTLGLTRRGAIVFVLVPGGKSALGALRPGVEAPAGFPLVADERLQPQEEAVNVVELAAYFLSKYELTQAQWLRLVGSNPSYNSVGKSFGGPTADMCYPVDHMSWLEGMQVLSRFGMSLPSEAQWEHAARAGTWTRYWWGMDADGVKQRANSGTWPHAETSLRADSYPPNPWGFYCILGNLGEWTSDNYWTSYRWKFADDGSGRQLSPASGLRVVRGGSFGHGVDLLRVTCRMDSPPNQPNPSFGLRPMRAIER